MRGSRTLNRTGFHGDSGLPLVRIAEPGKPGETRRQAMLCPSTSLGLLIQAGPGKAGGSGGLLTNRSGCAA